MSLSFKIGLLSICITSAVWSMSPNPDSLYSLARQNALSGNYSLAIDQCRQILKYQPQHFDSRNMIARVLAWQGKYSAAIHELDSIFAKDSIQYEALATRNDIYIWQQKKDTALHFVHYSLDHYPNDSLFLEQLRKLQQNDTEYYDFINIQHYFDHFNQPWVRRWHVSSIEFGKKRPNYTALLSFHLGDLVKDNERLYSHEVNQQVEATLYHDVYSGYLFLNYAFSPSPMFPRNKGALEYFHPFFAGKAEFSLGLRYFHFPQSTLHPLLVYTFSVNRVWDKSYLLFRYFITPINQKSYHSFFFKYSIHDEMQLRSIFFVAGYGASPDERQNARFYEIASLAGPYFRIGMHQKLFNKLYGYAEYGIRQENYIENKYRLHSDILLGIKLIF